MPLTGEAQVVGTLPYMSPEQLKGKGDDARSDIFAFGAVLYEMLSGRSAFQRPSNIGTIAAVDHEEPKPLHELVKDVPEDVERMIRRCLRKRAEERYGSVSEIEGELEACRALVSEPTSGINLRVLLRQSKRPGVAIPLLLVLLLLAGLSAWWLQRISKARWARDRAVPQIAKLIEQEKFGEAYALAAQAERYIPKDPMLVKLWPDMSWSASISTTPPRASYSAQDDSDLLQTSPLMRRLNECFSSPPPANVTATSSCSKERTG